MTITRSIVALLIAGAAGAALLAQTPAGQAIADSQLAALVTEVRQLREAVESASKAQTQTQATSVYLSAQQSRLIQVNAALTSVRSELSTAIAQSQEAARMVNLAKEAVGAATNPADRAEAEDMIKMFTARTEQTAAHEQRLRNRETDLAQQLQAEEQRWSALVSRLEQLIK